MRGSRRSPRSDRSAGGALRDEPKPSSPPGGGTRGSAPLPPGMRLTKEAIQHLRGSELRKVELQVVQGVLRLEHEVDERLGTGTEESYDVLDLRLRQLSYRGQLLLRPHDPRAVLEDHHHVLHTFFAHDAMERNVHRDLPPRRPAPPFRWRGSATRWSGARKR